MIALFAVSFTVAIKLYNDASPHALDTLLAIENRAKYPSSSLLSSESPKPEGPHRHRPTFVLHIGPSKTATSTLQTDCRKMQDQGILERDKTLFIGRASGIYRKTDPRLKWMHLKGLFGKACIKPWSDVTERPHLLTNSSCLKSYQMLEESYKMNQSIVYSDEAWSYNNHFGPWELYNSSVSDYLPYLRSTIFRDWDFHILIGYRDLYDWLVSAMKQKWGTECLLVKEWPPEGDKCPPPLMLNWASHDGHMNVRWYRYIDQTVDALLAGELEQNIHLWDFHSGEHITNYLFCNVVADSMPNACNYSQSRPELPTVNRRESTAQFYNDIVFHAATLKLPGLDVISQSRSDATTKLMEYHQTNLNRGIHDLPMYECPPRRQLQELLNKTLGIREKYMVANARNQSRRTDDEIRNHFWRLVDETFVFCQVDTQRLLHGSSSWDEVLGRLNSTWSDLGEVA